GGPNRSKTSDLRRAHHRGYLRTFQKNNTPTIETDLRGPFLPKEYGNLSDKFLSVWLQSVNVTPEFKSVANLSAFMSSDVISAKNISEIWTIPTVSKNMLDFVPDVLTKKIFDWEIQDGIVSESILRIQMSTNLQASFALALFVEIQPVDVYVSIILAGVVLLGLYAVIIAEIIPRTLAALCGSTMSVAILAAMNKNNILLELISWIDMDTLLLLFSMMMIMGVLSETGIFDYLSVVAYKVSRGKPLVLAALMCGITATLSIILDNVTTILLLTPCTIRFLQLLPSSLLMATVIFSNIGGCITPVGDIPNVIIVNNEHFIKGGVDFFTFSIHMGCGMILVLINTAILLSFKFNNASSLQYRESTEIVDLYRHVDVWERLASSLSPYSRDEEVVRVQLLNKIHNLRKELRKKRMTSSFRPQIDNLINDVSEEQLKTKCEGVKIKVVMRISMALFVKSGVALLFVIMLFFLRSVTDLHLSLGWIALLGAILLLILADNEPIGGVLGRVEWGTLLFFASLFILMEATARLGLIRWIGNQTEYIILSVNEESRLCIAILLILWVSALASAFVDNIPLTTMMVRIIENLNDELELPLQPLVWALAFGACLGGNGTLIGASANVVCAGVAEQHGYRFTFMEFFKVGFPIMIGNVLLISLYLSMLCFSEALASALLHQTILLWMRQTHHKAQFVATLTLSKQGAQLHPNVVKSDYFQFFVLTLVGLYRYVQDN
ncbi:hypothetical protein L9F63_024053, partial [Diploptera punctata]